jgi:hypothetical protein
VPHRYIPHRINSLEKFGEIINNNSLISDEIGKKFAVDYARKYFSPIDIEKVIKYF